jgi:hypothetical protein
MQCPVQSGTGFVQKESRIRAHIGVSVVLDQGMPLQGKKIGPQTIPLRFGLQGRRRRAHSVEEGTNSLGCRGAVPEILRREEKILLRDR